jgi:hypothetical protein
MNLTRNRPPNPYDYLPVVEELQVRSTSAGDGAELPVEHRAPSHGGENTSPDLEWSGAPEGTRSFAVSCFDIDAPTPSGVWHWLVVDIPASVTSLAAGVGSKPDAGVGAKTIRNDLGEAAYAGAAPPPGDHSHRYLFTVHALGVDQLEIPEGASPALASFMLGLATLARGHLTLSV